MGSKQFVLADVKTVDGDSANGEFEAILSAPTLDRDNEVIDPRAFEPLPASIPVHAYHDFSDPVGRGVPFYEGDVLKLRGFYASTPRAQEIRTLVAEGVIASMSVGFMGAQRYAGEDGKDHIGRGELLEGSMVSIPSNRDAAVLMAKSYTQPWVSVDDLRSALGLDTTSISSGDESGSKTPDDPETGSGASPDVKSGDAPEPSPAEAGAVPASVRAVIAEAQAHTV